MKQKCSVFKCSQYLLIELCETVVTSDCDSWYTLSEPNLPRSISRFGHTATAYQEKMYVFGGFDGTVHNDMFVYQPGQRRSSIDNMS
jgi:Kelch motif